jgi:hypothetical protein
MKFRIKAFGIHLCSSFVVLLLVLGTLYFGWYRWPAWYLLDVMSIVMVMAGVDLALGPVLTFFIANPAKPRRALARDVAVIVTIQLVALVYAALILWNGRPLYFTYSADRLEVVRAFEIDAADVAEARRLNPALAPHWNSRPRWVWAQMPGDAKTASEIVQSAIGGGPDVVDMPRYFKTWREGLPTLRKRLKPISELGILSKNVRSRVATQARGLNLSDTQANAMLLMGRTTQLVALFDLNSMHVVALLKTKGSLSSGHKATSGAPDLALQARP